MPLSISSPQLETKNQKAVADIESFKTILKKAFLFSNEEADQYGNAVRWAHQRMEQKEKNKARIQTWGGRIGITLSTDKNWGTFTASMLGAGLLGYLTLPLNLHWFPQFGLALLGGDFGAKVAHMSFDKKNAPKEKSKIKSFSDRVHYNMLTLKGAGWGSLEIVSMLALLPIQLTVLHLPVLKNKPLPNWLEKLHDKVEVLTEHVEEVKIQRTALRSRIDLPQELYLETLVNFLGLHKQMLASPNDLGAREDKPVDVTHVLRMIDASGEGIHYVPTFDKTLPTLGELIKKNERLSGFLLSKAEERFIHALEAKEEAKEMERTLPIQKEGLKEANRVRL